MPKLNYKTLRQEVVDEIRQRILSGEFKAGERIKENEIAELFGVSRGPVREALRQVEQEGLVRYERNIGCSVAEITDQDIYEVCLLRATLEILAVRLCGGKLSSEVLQKMGKSVERMKHWDDNLYQMAQEDNFFHGCVIGQAGFSKLEHIWKSMDVNNFAVFSAVQKANVRQNQYQRHQQLLDCYARGNLEELNEEIFRHYDLGVGGEPKGSRCQSMENLLRAQTGSR